MRGMQCLLAEARRSKAGVMTASGWYLACSISAIITIPIFLHNSTSALITTNSKLLSNSKIRWIWGDLKAAATAAARNDLK
jgi:hypothetical protein